VEEPVNDATPQPGGGRSEPAPKPPVWRPAFELERSRRRALLRRLAALLGTGTVAFTITTWILLRHESRSPRAGALPAAPGQLGEAAPDPAASGDAVAEAAALRAARAQLAALNKNDISGAYSYFSPRYRARVPLATFRKLVTAHRDMFHTEEQDVRTENRSTDRVVLQIHVTSDDDEDYVAQYTLVRVQGRWYVDDLRWGLDQDDGHTSA